MRFTNLLNEPYRDPYKSENAPFGTGADQFSTLCPGIIAELSQYLMPTAQLIAEIGCGEGWITREMARLFPRAIIFGYDVSEACLDKRTRILCADCRNIYLFNKDVTKEDIINPDILLLVNIGGEEEVYEQLKPGSLVVYSLQLPTGTSLRTMADVVANVPDCMEEVACLSGISIPEIRVLRRKGKRENLVDGVRC